MKISSLRIHNFRSVIDQVVSLYDFNLFVGSNNAGKSSCLDALRFFFASSDLTAESDVPLSGQDQADPVTWVQVKFEPENEAEKGALGEILPHGATAIRRRFRCGSEHSCGYCAVDEVGKVVKDNLTSVPKTLSRLFGELVYIPTSVDVSDFAKFSGSSTFRDFVSPVMESALSLGGSESYGKLKAALDEFAGSFSEDGRVVEFKKAMEESLARWGAGIDFSIAAPTASDIVRNMLSWTITKADGARPQDIAGKGSGFKRQFVFALLKACGELKGRKNAGTISGVSTGPCRRLLLFEEPEAFLHPDQQAELARDAPSCVRRIPGRLHNPFAAISQHEFRGLQVCSEDSQGKWRNAHRPDFGRRHRQIPRHGPDRAGRAGDGRQHERNQVPASSQRKGSVKRRVVGVGRLGLLSLLGVWETGREGDFIWVAA